MQDFTNGHPPPDGGLSPAQLNALNTAMPFLFEKIDDETELLLPDNLLNSDSLIRKLVGEMNGRIGHDREEAGGWTHFRLHLPMAVEARALSRKGERA